MTKITERFIKLQPVGKGPYQILPAETEAHFHRFNSRATKDQKLRILKPTEAEIKTFYPELFPEEVQAAAAPAKEKAKADSGSDASAAGVDTSTSDESVTKKDHVPFKGKGKKKAEVSK